MQVYENAGKICFRGSQVRHCYSSRWIYVIIIIIIPTMLTEIYIKNDVKFPKMSVIHNRGYEHKSKNFPGFSFWI